MKNLFFYCLLVIAIGIPQLSFSETVAEEAEPPVQLHGKALKEKEATIQIIEGTPNQAFQKLAPIWASKSNMEKTLKDIRKQAAKIGADAVIDVRVKTEKLQSQTVDPGFWAGPGWGGYGPWGGPWGGMGYWGGYVQAHTYTQPVVSGWAIKWEGPPPQKVTDTPPSKSLEEQVQDAPSE